MPAPDPAPSPRSTTPGDVAGVVEHLFRHEAGRIVAILTRVFGIEHLSLAEDVVQETLARALRTWPFYGIPDQPSAWIMRAARNLAVDVVRRQANFRSKEPDLIRIFDQPTPSPDQHAQLAPQLADDRLRLMFVCCHPQIPADAQAALALKTLCGFSITEISHAFLTSEAAIAKRLTRAKQRIRDARIPFEIPEGPDLAPRLDGVLQSLYLLFNEGYKASSGDRLIREDLCHEAIRLTALLAEHPAGDQPRTHALLALLLLNAARLPSRLDDEGNLLRLREQDRTRWDAPMIARGFFHLARSAAGNHLTEYHLQAGIAACHCAAPDEASTDWPRVLHLYDHLVELDHSPILALNRAVALAKVHGPQAALQALEPLRLSHRLQDYYLLHAVLGDLASQLNDHRAAATHFRRALELAHLGSEQRFLSQRFHDAEDRIPPS